MFFFLEASGLSGVFVFQFRRLLHSPVLFFLNFGGFYTFIILDSGKNTIRLGGVLNSFHVVFCNFEGFYTPGGFCVFLVWLLHSRWFLCFFGLASTLAGVFVSKLRRLLHSPVFGFYTIHNP